jgi:hypothetical protein
VVSPAFRDEAVERTGRYLQRSLTRGLTTSGGFTLDRCNPLDQGKYQEISFSTANKQACHTEQLNLCKQIANLY